MNTQTGSVLALPAVLLFAGLASAQTASTAPRGQRPHIVLFIADDQSWHDSGPYGDRDVRTPHLDKLAREGMKFELAFAASPTCTPSRRIMNRSPSV